MAEPKMSFARRLSSGTHTFKITGVRIQDETPSGFPMWWFDVQVDDKKDNDDGMDSSVGVSDSPRALFKKAEFLDALGAPEKGEAGKNWFVGKKFKATIEVTMNDGATRVNFNNFLSVSAESPTQPAIPGLPSDQRAGGRPAPSFKKPADKPAEVVAEESGNGAEAQSS